MRTVTVISTAAVALTASLYFSRAANTERVCKERCGAGVSEQKCVEMRDGDRDHDGLEDRRDHKDRDRDQERRPGVELHVPGLNVDVGR